MPLDEQNLTNKLYRVITRNRELDPLSLAEKLTERIVDYLEDAGVVDPGVGLAGSIAEAREQIREAEVIPLAPRRPVLQRAREKRDPGPPPQPPPSSRLIVTPEDPEFQKARQLLVEERGARVSAVRVNKVGSASGSDAETIYWQTPQLIAYLEKNFPKEFPFVPVGMEGKGPQGTDVVLTAERDIKAQIMTYGADQVRIEYAHAGINRDGMDFTQPVGDGLAQVNIAPIASHTFSCADQNVDVEGVLRKIGEQLCGLYAPRRKHMEPGYIGEPPIDSWSNNQDGMKDNDAIRGSRGWSMVDNPAESVRGNVFRLNQQVGTPGWKP